MLHNCQDDSCQQLVMTTTQQACLSTKFTTSTYPTYPSRSYHHRCTPEAPTQLQWLAQCAFRVHFREYESTPTGFVLSASDASTMYMPRHNLGLLSQYKQSLATNPQLRSQFDAAGAVYVITPTPGGGGSDQWLQKQRDQFRCMIPQPLLDAATLLRCLDFGLLLLD